MSMVFQEPLAAFDPRWTVGQIVAEPLLIHRHDMNHEQRRAKIIRSLAAVTLDESLYDRSPRSLSGGQAQRVGIARAIVTDPELLILDEPTSSLDLSVRAQVLELLARLQRDLKMSYVFISHDLQSVRAVTQRAIVMYLGQVMESGPTEELLRSPRHPYTRMLLDSEMSIHKRRRTGPGPAGEIPTPTSLPTGCFFYSRCPVRRPECTIGPIGLRVAGPGHEAACILVGGSNGRPSSSTGAAPIAPDARGGGVK
jgi:oligopeptide/dipeptide ABC transporter ATP-binding protein